MSVVVGSSYEPLSILPKPTGRTVSRHWRSPSKTKTLRVPHPSHRSGVRAVRPCSPRTASHWPQLVVSSP